MTQPRMCKCITSYKELKNETIYDTFTLECSGKQYKSNLVFEKTGVNGQLKGTWNQPEFPILRFNIHKYIVGFDLMTPLLIFQLL
jgi:hypothetical protein